MKKPFLPLEALRRCVSVSSKGPEEAPKPRKRGVPAQASEASPASGESTTRASASASNAQSLLPGSESSISGESTTRASASCARSLLPSSQPSFGLSSTAQLATNTQGRAAPSCSSPTQSLLVPPTQTVLMPILGRSASAPRTQQPGSHPPLRPHAHHVSGILTPSAVVVDPSGYAAATKRPPEFVRHVYFAPSPMNTVVEITPYSKVYGMHPASFEFHCDGMQLIDGSNIPLAIGDT